MGRTGCKPGFSLLLRFHTGTQLEELSVLFHTHNVSQKKFSTHKEVKKTPGKQ